jgi:hypothetical protein
MEIYFMLARIVLTRMSSFGRHHWWTSLGALCLEIAISDGILSIAAIFFPTVWFQDGVSRNSTICFHHEHVLYVSYRKKLTSINRAGSFFTTYWELPHVAARAHVPTASLQLQNSAQKEKIQLQMGRLVQRLEVQQMKRNVHSGPGGGAVTRHIHTAYAYPYSVKTFSCSLINQRSPPDMSRGHTQKMGRSRDFTHFHRGGEHIYTTICPLCASGHQILFSYHPIYLFPAKTLTSTNHVFSHTRIANVQVRNLHPVAHVCLKEHSIMSVRGTSPLD